MLAGRTGCVVAEALPVKRRHKMIRTVSHVFLVIFSPMVCDMKVNRDVLHYFLDGEIITEPSVDCV
jgi:hypothetical protein